RSVNMTVQTPLNSNVSVSDDARQYTGNPTPELQLGSANWGWSDYHTDGGMIDLPSQGNWINSIQATQWSGMTDWVAVGANRSTISLDQNGDTANPPSLGRVLISRVNGK